MWQRKQIQLKSGSAQSSIMLYFSWLLHFRHYVYTCVHVCACVATHICLWACIIYVLLIPSGREITQQSLLLHQFLSQSQPTILPLISWLICRTLLHTLASDIRICLPTLDSAFPVMACGVSKSVRSPGVWAGAKGAFCQHWLSGLFPDEHLSGPSSSPMKLLGVPRRSQTLEGGGIPTCMQYKGKCFFPSSVGCQMLSWSDFSPFVPRSFHLFVLPLHAEARKQENEELYERGRKK